MTDGDQRYRGGQWMDGEEAAADIIATKRRRRRLVRSLKYALIAVPIGSILLSWFLMVTACGCQPPAPTLPPSPVEGVVVAVDATSLTQVLAFDMRIAGFAYVVHLEMGSLENPTQFPPGHLASHQATGQPIRAYYTLQAGVPYVYRLEDAVLASQAPGAT